LLRASNLIYYNFDCGIDLRPFQYVAILQASIFRDALPLQSDDSPDALDPEEVGRRLHYLTTVQLGKALHRYLNYVTLLIARGSKDQVLATVTQEILDATFAKTMAEIELVDVAENLRETIKGNIIDDRQLLESTKPQSLVQR
jgi:hypothetical protein